MPKKTKTKTEKEETFNWKGIKDNGDGTFDVSDKYAKNRLQKEFRRQGIRSRSQKTGTKGYVVYPVGQRKQRAVGRARMPRKELTRYPGYKPRTRVRAIGPRPQLRPGRPGFRGRPVLGGGGWGGHPVIRGSRQKGGIPQAIMKAADKRTQKVRESQVSPYTPEGKPRPGYQTYIDKTGTQRIVKMPTGTWRDRFASKQQKEMVREARIAESHEIEKGMAERSKGQPSTRIPTQEERFLAHHEHERETRRQIRDTQIAEKHAGIREERRQTRRDQVAREKQAGGHYEQGALIKSPEAPKERKIDPAYLQQRRADHVQHREELDYDVSKGSYLGGESRDK